jgi:UDPglucose 6-dehydrogenase
MGHEVICVDNDQAKVGLLNQGGIPIYEENLPELLAKQLNNGLSFTTDLASAVENSEAVFIAVGTPQSTDGAADLSHVEAVVSGKEHGARLHERVDPARVASARS